MRNKLFITNLLAVFMLVSTLTFQTQAATSIVDIYKKLETKWFPIYCEKRFKDKNILKKCTQSATKIVNNECGAKPWENCMFDLNGKYIVAGTKNWQDLDKLFDKNIKF